MSLLSGAAWEAAAGEIAWLAMFCIVAVPLGLVAFSVGFDKVRREGTLGFY
ncbi:MAG: hypothetical protein JXP37_05520 [Coriobacteriia bacterium]|nr:hypothetical protein [Coriobacteriia bacterium]